MLRLETELRQSRLELSQLEESAGRLRAELARTREAAEEDARLRVELDVQRLVVAIGAPLVQLMTQAHLHRTGAARVTADDVLDVGTRLVRALREAGVDTVGETGETEPFDPQRHDALSTAMAPRAGRSVVVCAVGLSYRGRIVRKAGVEATGEVMDAHGLGPGSGMGYADAGEH